MTYKFSSNNFQGNRRPFSKVWSYQLRKSCNNLCSVPSSSTILLVVRFVPLQFFIYTIFITSPNFTILNSSIYHPFKYILVFFSFLRFFFLRYLSIYTKVRGIAWKNDVMPSNFTTKSREKLYVMKSFVCKTWKQKKYNLVNFFSFSTKRVVPNKTHTKSFQFVRTWP